MRIRFTHPPRIHLEQGTSIHATVLSFSASSKVRVHVVNSNSVFSLQFVGET